MEINEIVSLISVLSDREKGGDNALNGFEFQVSTAIYLVFEQYREDSDFALMYEKLEDFLIINDKINLYQAKGVNFNITPNQLTKNRSASNNHESIIEKMYDNYLQVKEAIGDVEIETNLLICESKTFSKLLWDSSPDYDKDIRDVSFSTFGDSCKSEIINNTRHKEYEWENIKARKLIPKPRHEEVTRMFIEDVVTEKKGENKINSKSLYQAFVYEINKIRKNKGVISREFLEQNLSNFITLGSDIRFENVNYLLEDEDKRNLKIRRYFEEYKISYNINCHPTNSDYILISSIYSDKFSNLYEFIDEIKFNDYCVNLLDKLNEFELKALTLLVVCKEGKIT